MSSQIVLSEYAAGTYLFYWIGSSGFNVALSVCIKVVVLFMERASGTTYSLEAAHFSFQQEYNCGQCIEPASLAKHTLEVAVGTVLI